MHISFDSHELPHEERAMSEETVPVWVERMRAAGYAVTPATLDVLPDPEHVLPAPVADRPVHSRGIKRLLRSHRPPYRRHARLP